MTEIPAAAGTRRLVNSLCGMCATHCPIQVAVVDGRATWLQGNPNDGGMGTSLCARGGAGLALQDDDERPQTPLIRVGARGAGQWRAVGWDEALDHVARVLKEVVAADGPKAIALSDRGGDFSDLTRAFVRALGSPNYFDHDVACARNAHHACRSLFGRGRGGFAYDIRHTRHMVLYGRNITESLQVKEARDFMAAMAAGARCTYVDPRVTGTACKATRYWQIRPHADYALNLAILHQVIADGLYDRAFVARWVEGFDALAEFVRPYSPDWQAAHTGIPAAELRAFVDEIAADAPHVIFHGGWNTARHRQSFHVSRTAYLLNALMGSIESPGGMLVAKGAADVGRAGLNSLAAGIPQPADPRVDGAGTTHPHWDPAAGILHRLLPAVAHGDPYRVRAWFAYRHDPLSALPDPEAQLRAMDKLRLLVAIDVNWSETAWQADVVLPESTYLERANILALKPGPRPAVHMRDQAVAPRFDSRPAWWIFAEIARRMGAGRHFPFDRIEDIWAMQLEGTGLTIEALRATGVVALADKPVYFDRADGLPFKTPSGKVEVECAALAAAGLPSLAPYQPPEPLAAGSFRLLAGRAPVQTHAQTANNPLLAELAPDNPLWIHPGPAAALGIADGDPIEVAAAGYAVRSHARVTDAIHPEAVFMLHGFGRTVPLQSRACGRGVADQRLQVGLLDRFDPAGGGIAYGEAQVSVRRVPQ